MHFREGTPARLLVPRHTKSFGPAGHPTAASARSLQPRTVP